MADWCIYGVGYNSKDISELCENDALEGEYEECSYYAPLLLIETENLTLFHPDSETEESAVENGSAFITRGEGEILIDNQHPNFEAICDLIGNSVFPNTYIVNGEIRDFKDAKDYASNSNLHHISIWEAEIA